MKPQIFVILLLLNSFVLDAQFYNTGQLPFRLRWKQIETEHFKILFPEEVSHEGQRVANLLETVYPNANRGLVNKPKKITVVLNNHTSSPNGLVAWAPKRMELDLNPPPDMISQPWLEELALHEYRHVVQLDKLNRGLTKVGSILTGQISVGGVSSYVPTWFFEGDAVWAETAFSKSGRGRDPSFQKGLRGILLEKEPYSYQKAYFGSFKDYVPNEYELGYHITGYARDRFGTDIWNDVVNQVGKWPIPPRPFYWGLKKTMESSKSETYNETMDFLTKRWKSETNQTDYMLYKRLSVPSPKIDDDFINYRTPIGAKQNKILSLKSGLGFYRQFVLIDSLGNEVLIHRPGISYDYRLSSTDDKIVWSEIVPGTLWERTSYHQIKILDLSNGSVRNLKKKGKSYSPAISPDGSKIAAVETNTENLQSIIIYETDDGSVLKKISTPNNEYPQDIDWHPEQKKLLLLLTGTEGKRIVELHLDENRWSTLLEPTYANLFRPMYFNSFVVFGASFSSIDNVYALEIGSRNLFRVTNTKLGAYDPHIGRNADELLFSEYTSNGHKIAMLKLTPSEWEAYSLKETKDIALFQSVKNKDNWTLNEETIEQKQYETSRYHKAFHLVHIHSWAPFNFNTESFSISDPKIYPGAQVFFQNMLNTVIGNASYAFRENDHYFSTSISYLGTRPAFEYRLDIGGSPSLLKLEDISVPPQNFNTKSISHRLRAYLPLNLSRSNFVNYLEPAVQFIHENDVYQVAGADNFQQGIGYLRYSLTGYTLMRMAHRDIRSPFGLLTQLNYFTDAGNNIDMGTYSNFYAALYLPGLFRNNSLKVSGALQKKKIGSYRMPFSYIYSARGLHQTTAYSRMNVAKVDYAFPIYYPDWSITNLLYIKRFRGNLFFDLANFNFVDRNQSGTVNTYDYQSYGIELNTDLIIAQFVFPFTAGMRFGYENFTNSTFWDILFTMDITGF